MGRDWSKYNEELVKRGELLIDPISFGLKAEEKKRKSGIIYNKLGWYKVVFGQSGRR